MSAELLIGIVLGFTTGMLLRAIVRGRSRRRHDDEP